MYTKTSLSGKELTGGIVDTALNAPRLFSAFRSNRVSNSLTEKIMLSVTSVYECRYCNWMHSELASLFGVSEDEIERLLNGDLSDVSEEQLVALRYALEGGEINIRPRYDEETAEDIEQFVRFVAFTNKLGNTFDEFISLWVDKDSPKKGIFVPGLVFFAMFPVYFTVSLLTKKGKNPLFDLST